jgi:hypothetical protein
MLNHYLTDNEIALKLAQSIREWRISPAGAGMTQVNLAKKSGVGLTPLKRFEKTGAITLKNLIAIIRALDFLDRLNNLIPDASDPGPIARFEMERKQLKLKRKRAPRKNTGE